MRTTLGSDLEGYDSVLVHRRWEVSVPALSWWRGFVVSRNRTKPKLELFSPPWIRADPIMAVVLEPQWEMNPRGYWFWVTVCWNLASHSRNAISMGATSNCGGLLRSFTSIFHLPMALSQAPASTQRCRAGLCGSVTGTKTFSNMLRVNPQCFDTPLCSSALQLLFRFPGLRQAGGNWGYMERMGGVQGWAEEQDGGALFQWRPWAQPVWVGITKKKG